MALNVHIRNQVFADEFVIEPYIGLAFLDSCLAGTKTTIKWDYERVIILRSGTVDCRQEFAGGLVSESMYRTPYLALPMRLTTEYLYVYAPIKVHLAMHEKQEKFRFRETV